MTYTYSDIMEALRSFANPVRAEHSQRYFKTGKGEYAEGDIFLGLSVPNVRSIAKDVYAHTELGTIQELLYDEIHEARLLAVIVLTLQYKAAKQDFSIKQQIVDFYVKHRNRVNNWDLVDSSTHKILGPYVQETGDWSILESLSKEECIWSKRIAVVALWHLFKYGYYEEGLDILLKNLRHSHDLMHKANGWMLRELWKVNPERAMEFIDDYMEVMPRTTLRYAIEKLEASERKAILQRT